MLGLRPPAVAMWPSPLRDPCLSFLFLMGGCDVCLSLALFRVLSAFVKAQLFSCVSCFASLNPGIKQSWAKIHSAKAWICTLSATTAKRLLATILDKPWLMPAAET